MRLTSIALTNFRNYASLQATPAPGLNLFVGANAQGKSNLLEAIAMLGTGKSFRAAHEGDTVRFDTQQAVVRGNATVGAGSVALACTIATTASGTRKAYTYNGHDVRYAGFLGKLRVVTFVPADLGLAGGAPSLRRAFCNAALSQAQPQYYHHLARYRKTIQQKNALLRAERAPDADLLRTYDAALIENGTAIMLARERFVAEVGELAARAHARFSAERECLTVTYRPNVAPREWTAPGVAAAFEASLAQAAAREASRKAAIVGPHHDDLSLELGDRALGAYGSQGQRRTAVLALKTAEYTVARERAGEAPLLLLDDVLSELDDARAAAFLEGIGDYEQAFVTATSLPPGTPPEAARSSVEAVEGCARIRPCSSD